MAVVQHEGHISCLFPFLYDNEVLMPNATWYYKLSAAAVNSWSLNKSTIKIDINTVLIEISLISFLSSLIEI